jgi:HAD superfamily hydrolase (TIGR01450 family)
MQPHLRNIRHVALDMDGTIYRGETLFDFTPPFLKLLAQLGIGHTFLTNNPSKNHADYLAHLRKMGIEAAPDQLYTSSQATIEFLQEKWPVLKRLFVLGTPGMCQEFAAAGFELLPDDPAQAPDAVVVSFDTTLTYPRLCRAAWWIAQGKPYFATNPDTCCPTDQPTVMVDCGAITAALEKAAGRPPTAVLGKPDVAMLTGILQRHSLKPGQLAMVGDRLYTDIAMAQNAGAFGVLVLSGETTAAQAAQHQPPPNLVVPTLAEFGAQLLANHSNLAKTQAAM